ncbi:DUF1877 family protein [Streptomyces sp. NPDC001941]|uniref:DUF1877 family protein n=1 Tax=Streptomyces sp. NPDC001941 TaxID=3154659 RepID=UPI00332C7CF0
MALTQNLARVSPAYLARCRQAAEESPSGDPRWDPPDEDVLDLDWAMWGLIRLFRWARIDPAHIEALERSIHGDAAGVAFLDHLEFYDRMDTPPALVRPRDVGEIAGLLDAIDWNTALALFPEDPVLAAQVSGLDGFAGNLPAYLTEHFEALRAFYRLASERRLAVVTWVD